MFKKRIYTLIEVKNRELLGKSLFAIDLAEAGYSIVIGKKVIYIIIQNILHLGYFSSKAWALTI